MNPRRCVIYVRISVSKEDSVSIERQIKAARQYAAARGWSVVAVFRDDGISATHNRPEDRTGWGSLLNHPDPYDAVVIWKVDRLARRVLDFLHADEALQKRGAGIVAVEDPIDMTTPQGRAFATVLAVFGEMEAAAISARVKAARSHLLRSGRVVGGKVPYGWRSVRNPDGAGYVLAQEPDTIGWVRGMADRVLAGGSVYSVVQWLNDQAAPTPTWKGVPFAIGPWNYNTVERILRHPLLAGMTPFNPGNGGKERGSEVLRDSDGMPVVDESVAILALREWRLMVKQLDDRDSAQARPRASKTKTSPLLSGLVWCGEHLDDDGNGTRMSRGTAQGRHGYYCPVCHQTITNFEDVAIEEFLHQKGDRVRWPVVHEVHEGGAAVLPEIEHRLTELMAQLQATDDDAEADDLTEKISNLRAMRREARASEPKVVQRQAWPAQHFGEDWAEATEVADRQAILADAMHRLWVIRGRTGRPSKGSVLARLVFDWKQPEDLGPTEYDAADETGGE